MTAGCLEAWVEQSRGIISWPFWGLPRKLQAYIIAVAVLALAMAGWQATTEGSLTVSNFAILGMFLACGVIVAETSRGFLRGVANQFRQDLNSAWKLPILYLLPPFFAIIAPVLFVLFWERSVRRRTIRYRQVFTISTLAIGDGIASILFHHLVRVGTPVYIWLGVGLLAAVVARLCNMTFLAIVLRFTQPDSVREIYDRETLLYSSIEICLGIVVAILALRSPLLVILAVPPVILLHRGLLHEQLRQMSRTDTKTAVLNAGAWEQDAAMELARAKRDNEPTSVLICDIDHFKMVNDQYGHLNGDLALKAVAQRLQALLRQGDILGRFGGEEFVILLSGIGMVNAKSIAERLRRNVGNDPVQLDNASIHLTVSLGVATSEESHESLPEMLAAADEAMYLAKRRGRDQVIITRTLRPAEGVELDELAGPGDGAAGSDEVAEPTDEVAEPADADTEAPARRASGRAGGM